MSLLPSDIRVFERGWLSSNNVLLHSTRGSCLIDSGYHSHSGQTLSLVQAALGNTPLVTLVNTHLHSDHCGGNAALQVRYPGLRTMIPPGQACHVENWDAEALSYQPTGQVCPPFYFDCTLLPGDVLSIGERKWQVYAAPGHDPHSVILFDPSSKILISADALWQNGFGVVFPEIEGHQAFKEVADTLELIDSLRPLVVIPGHGAVFQDVTAALDSARRRLDGFVAAPQRHALHAAKVLLKFKLLEVQRFSTTALASWVEQTTYFGLLHRSYFADQALSEWVQGLLQDLVRSGAARLEGTIWLNT